ncbi:hypothetical protein KY339_02540 [Candidatus Woesearchaeota archaeon]|nr:hypothetical protein [Candidatus Woesearchaeota archaeon]
MSDLRKAILQETIEREIAEQNSGDIIEYLNNFWCHFDGEIRRSYYKKLYDFVEKEGIPMWSSTHNDNFERIDREELRQAEIKMHSNLFLLQTPKEFYQTLEKAIEEADIDIGMLKINIDGRFVGTPDKEKVEFFRQILLPVYLIMREKGYNHHELCK